jgi:hypothetical protein
MVTDNTPCDELQDDPKDRTRRAAAPQEPGSARRGGLKEALPSNSVPLLLRPLLAALGARCGFQRAGMPLDLIKLAGRQLDGMRPMVGHKYAVSP